MIKFLLRTALMALVWLGLSSIGFITVQDFGTAFIAVLMLGVLNTFVGGLLKLLTFPINFLTLGLVGVIINLFVLYLLDTILSGIALGNVFNLFILSIVLGFASSVIDSVVRKK